MRELLYICCFALPSAFILTFCIIALLQNFFSAPFVPSSGKKFDALLAELNLDKQKKIIDIGCGDGRIVFTAAKYFDNVTGIEVNPYLHIYNQTRRLFSPNREKVKFKLGSIFREDFHKYGLVYVYLFPEMMHKLEDKLFSELPKGSWIISHTFKFAKREPIRKLHKHYLIYEV